MTDTGTTQAVQCYLDELARLPAGAPAEPIVRALLGRAVDRLHALCATLLYRQYPRLTRGPLNLQSEEMLAEVVERLIKAMRSTRPRTVRHFFALANQHMRWELNELARRLDQQQEAVVALSDSIAAEAVMLPPPGDASGSSASPGGEAARRVLAAIEGLPEEEREVFTLVRVQGMTHAEAAAVVGTSTKTIQRRLSRCLVLLTEHLGDLVSPPPGAPVRPAQPRQQQRV
ncbi:MAG TPA: sigma-70 family RNA polymerase sigma factor [Tepidisphaeraceae bacterium]|nr:sigma-70 family RNA polymerase sigma factor [Tepidisphaeraceae bacterium]